MLIPRPTYLGVLRSLETRLAWGFGETKPGQTRGDNMEAGMVGSSGRQEWKELPDLKEGAGPYNDTVSDTACIAGGCLQPWANSRGIAPATSLFCWT